MAEVVALAVAVQAAAVRPPLVAKTAVRAGVLRVPEAADRAPAEVAVPAATLATKTIMESD